MVQRHLTALLLAAATVAAPLAARAQRGGDMMPQPAMETFDARAMARFPQPVRVGDLRGRLLLAPTEAQPVLGRVIGVARGGDGALALLVARGGLLGLGATPVAVPIGAVALLGEHVGLVDMAPRAFRALPRIDVASAPVLGANETIRVGLTAPFH